MTIQEFFENNPRTAIAFSGGVDSSYLLYASVKYGQDVTAYFVKSEFQPQFELDDAKRLAEELGAKLSIIQLSVLEDPVVKSNCPRRCYYCKKVIFSKIAEQARKDGYPVLLDGTNASDEAGDRPGMQALRELSVMSPLRECGLTKEEIRRLSARRDFSPGASRHTHVLPQESPQGRKSPGKISGLRNLQKTNCQQWVFQISVSERTETLPESRFLKRR